uniref:E3 ubiquitin-protein ligase SIS3-like n=1 Tax=Tanacetum cinerariifolium TaxID=118510 RepID=A0A6L2L911_TANCI|nr:E3 ubiquitin-protein ligase SIS3-like [Tanacetum cinerariifolium]
MIKDKVCSLAEPGGGYLILEARWCTSSFWSSSVRLSLERQYLIWTWLEIYSFSWMELGDVRAGENPRQGGSECLLDQDLIYGDFMGTPPSYTLIKDPMLRLCHKLIACSIDGRSQAPEKVTVTDLFYQRGMNISSVNIPHLLARYLRLFASGRKHGAMISGAQYVARLAEHFGLLTKERLKALKVIIGDLPIIDISKLVRLQICFELDDTWAWVPARPARQKGREDCLIRGRGAWYALGAPGSKRGRCALHEIFKVTGDVVDFRTWLGISIRDHNDEYYGFRWSDLFKLRAAMDTVIQRLPVYILKAVPMDCSDCPICLEEFCIGQEVRGLPCAHNFHVACIHTWLKLNVKCHRCRCSMFPDANSNELSAYPINPGRLSISTSRDLRVQPPHSIYLMRMQSFLLPVHTDNQQPLNSSSSSSLRSGFGSTTINSPDTRSMLVEQGGGASDDNDDLPASVEPVTQAQALDST